MLGREINNQTTDNNGEYRSVITQTITRKYAGFLFLLGFSIIGSVIFSSYMNKNIDKFKLLIKNVDEVNIFLLMAAFIMIVEGIAYYRVVQSTINYKKEDLNEPIKLILNKIIFPIFKDLLKVSLNKIPYLTLIIVALLYLKLPTEKSKDFLADYSKILALNTIFFFALLYEVNRGFLSLVEIVKGSVKDSKDRLSIVITIVATIVSIIALFK